MPLSTKSVILKAPGTDDELIDKVEELLRGWTAKHQLNFQFAERVSHSPGMVVHVWHEPERAGLEVRLVFDDVANLRYLSVRSASADQDDLQRVLLAEISEAFAVLSLEELREAARTDPGDPGVWMQLALGVGGDFDEEGFELVCAALETSDVGERRGAAEAAALLQWHQLTGPLEAALDREQVESLRQLLELALMVCSAPAV